MKNNQIGSRTVLEDEFHPLESLTTGTDDYIGTGSIISNQVSEGKTRGVTVEFVTLADNCIIGTTTGIAPGVQIDANTEVAPLSGIPKNIHLNANMIYEGLPVRRGSTKGGNQEWHIQCP